MFGSKRIHLAACLAGVSLLISGCVVGNTEPDFEFAELNIKTDNENICWRIVIEGDSRIGCGDKGYTFNSDKGHFDATVIKRSGLGGLSVEIWVDEEFVDSATVKDAKGSVTISSKP